VSQDFRIAEAIRRSNVQGATFGWYPTGLNSGHELRGSYIRTVDDYPALSLPELTNRPRIVYEFDSADLLTGYMYPAMARTFRAGGVQFAAMFAYDMLATASRNLGWQTHYLNLVYTPRKALSAVIAAEAMRRLPRMQGYGAYPANTRFGDFRVSAEENLGELTAPDAFLYTGSTHTRPPYPERLRRIAGSGSSPVISYDGLGSYFLDKIRDGVWRLELYPDAVPVRDPFEMPSPDKIVTRAIYRAWPMTLKLADLGESFTIERIAGPDSRLGRVTRAERGRFTASPGVFILSAHGGGPRTMLPAFIGRVRVDEFHAPPADSAAVEVEPLASAEYLSGRPVEIGARVVDETPPDSVTLWLRPSRLGRFRPFPMQPTTGYDYRASIPASALTEGSFEYAIGIVRNGVAMTFPEKFRRRPSDWDFSSERFWTLRVIPATTPLRLFRPAADVSRLAFTRIGDAGRQGIFRLVPSRATGADVFHLELPVFSGRGVEDYTASLVVKERIEARRETIARAQTLRLRLRGVGAHQRLHVTLVERDGTSWSAAVDVDSMWTERVIPLSELKAAGGVMLPQGFPGNWNYWLTPAKGRGASGDAVRLADVERLQLSLRDDRSAPVEPGSYGVEIEFITLDFR
jgi:hypothetical protein